MQMCKIFFLFFQKCFRSETVHLLLTIILESFKLNYFFLTSNTCDEYFALRTQINLDASSCQAIANLDARDFLCEVSGFGQFFIVSGVPTFVYRPLKIQMFSSQTFMFESTLNLFSRYVSTVGSCVDVAGRDSCRFCTMYLHLCTEDLNQQFSEPLSPANFHKPGPFCSSATTLARFFHVEIFLLVGESSTKFARRISCCA